MERGAVARGRPQFATLPTYVRVIDATLQTLGKEAHRVGHPQLEDSVADQRMQRVRLVARGNRHIGAKTQNVVLVYPDKIRVLFGARVAQETRAGQCVKRKALGAFFALLGTGAVERT